jgi:hypothetical protein
MVLVEHAVMSKKALRPRLTILGLAVLAAGAAVAADVPDPGSQLAGHSFSWSLVSQGDKKGQCKEEWSFGQDGTMTVLSGEEQVAKRYAVRPQPGSTMVILEATRVSTNGKADCQGVRNSKIGQTSQTYLMFLNGGGFFTCVSTDTMSCYGVATPKP